MNIFKPMTAIAVPFTGKTYDTLPDGRKHTPYTLLWWFHGNVMLRKGFLNKAWFYNGTVLHVLGFRFSRSITKTNAVRCVKTGL